MEFKKLKLKTNQVMVGNLEPQILELISSEFEVVKSSEAILLTIVKEAEFTQINTFIDDLDLDTDLTIWIMYPKGSSKQFKGVVEVNRDGIRTKINDKVKTVSMVSLDSDWSAMRVRSKKFSK